METAMTTTDTANRDFIEQVVLPALGGSAPLPEEDEQPEIAPVLTEETWLERRQHYIGGSDCASMFADPRLPSFGKDGIRYGCARRLVYEKQGREPDFKRTRREEQNFSRGHDLEPLVAKKFVAENGLGLKVRRYPPHRMSRSHPHAGVNLDYHIVGVNDEQLSNIFGASGLASGPGVLECKTANEFVFAEVADKKGAIVDYVFQSQHAMAVTGNNWSIFAVLGFGAALWDLSWFPMLADKRLGQRILQRTGEVWDMVEGRAELPPPLPQPDVCDRCVHCPFRKSCLGSAFVPALPTDGVYHERPDLLELAVEYRQAQQAEVAAKARKDAIGKLLITQVDKNGRFLLPKTRLNPDDPEETQLVGGRFYDVVPMLDQKALREEQPKIAEQYTRTIPKDFVKIWERGKKKQEEE